MRSIAENVASLPSLSFIIYYCNLVLVIYTMMWSSNHSALCYRFSYIQCFLFHSTNDYILITYSYLLKYSLFNVFQLSEGCCAMASGIFMGWQGAWPHSPHSCWARRGLTPKKNTGKIFHSKQKKGARGKGIKSNFWLGTNFWRLASEMISLPSPTVPKPPMLMDMFL